MKHVPYVSIILENAAGEVLLVLRENRSTTTCPNHWTLIGGKIGAGETPEAAARRTLEAETGLKTAVSFWKCYEREHPLFIVDQHIFVARAEGSQKLLVVGRDMQFFRPDELEYLDIGYGFASLLREYMLIHER